MELKNNRTVLISLMFVVFSASWYLTNLQSMIEDMVVWQIAYTTFYCVVVIALEIGFIWIAVKLVPKFKFQFSYALYGLFGAFNVLAFSLSFYTDFLTQPPWIKLAIIIGIIIFLSVIFRLMSMNLKLIKILLLLYVSYVGMQISFVVYLQTEETRTINGDTLTGEIANSETLGKVKFQKSPNVHLISVDSLLPPSLAKKHLGISTLKYSDETIALQGQVVRNLFADKVFTRDSLNSVLALNSNPYLDRQKYFYFSGQKNSPVSFIFHNNNYKVSTGYSRKQYFGKKGPYVDDELFASYDRCEFKLPFFFFQHFNYCQVIEYIQDHTQLKILAEEKGRDWIEILMESYEEKAKDTKPWFTFNYIYNPIGHTPATYRNTKAERDRYKKHVVDQDAKMAKILFNLINFIKENDPNSIVFVFGDHGPILSRNTTFIEDPEFFIQDRFGVFGAIWDLGNSCGEDIDFNRHKQFATLSMVMTDILVCLSGNDKPIRNVIDYDWDYNFSKYVYE